MSGIIHATSAQELLRAFNKIPPLSECDFYLHFQSTSGNGTYGLFQLVNFTIPQFGISFSQDSESLCYNKPQVNASSVDITFLSPKEAGESSLLENLYKKQFNANGTLKFIKVKELPTFTIFARKVQSGVIHDLPIISLEGCRVSFPTPAVNLGSVNASVFRTSISYNNYTII